MSRIKFPKNVMEKAPDAYKLISSSFAEQVVFYIINSKYRKSVKLVPWLEQQVIEAKNNPSFMKLVNSIDSSDDYDKQILSILAWGKNKNWLSYVGDMDTWDMPEYWQTALETFGLKTGDCEDGAIMMYVIARLKGIPANRLMLFAGSVRGGGHCWLGYRPSEYPLNWAFLDWCYWYNGNTMNYRDLYYINGQKIYTYDRYNKLVSVDKENYYSIWFGFNEDKSHRVIRYDSSLR